MKKKVINYVNASALAPWTHLTMSVSVLERTWHVHGKDMADVKDMVTSDIQPIINFKTLMSVSLEKPSVLETNLE